MRRRGFTILELLIALSLFLIGMVSILEIFPVDRNLLNQTMHSTQASFLAQEQMEQVVATPYSSLTVGTYLPNAVVTTDTTSPYSIYSRQVTVDYINSSYAVSGTDTGLKRVTVTISWQERTFMQYSTLTTYVHS